MMLKVKTQILEVLLILILTIPNSTPELLEGYQQETFTLVAPPNPNGNLPILVTTMAELDSSSTKSETKNAVHFSVSYKGFFNQWTLVLEAGQSHGVIQKTLCDATISHNSSIPTTSPAVEHRDQQIYIVAYSRTVNRLRLDITAGRNENFFLKAGESSEVEINPFSSQVYQYQPTTESAVMLTVEDDTHDYICMFVAINPPSCPWYDSTNTIQNSKIWSRVLRLGYFTIETKDFPDGFQVTLMTIADNSECISQNNDPETSYRNKRVRIHIDHLEMNYKKPVSVALVVLVMMAVAFTAIWILLWYCWTKPNYEEDGEDENVELQGQNSLESNGVTGHTTSEEEDRLLQALIEAGYGETDCEVKTALQAAIRRLKVQTRGDLDLNDMIHMTKRCVWHRRVRSYGYVFVVPLISCFYFIPSIQMVLAEWYRSEDSGNRDRCYHNHGCSRPYGMFPDFNHTISNAGYIIYGVVFIGIVFLKSKILPEEHKSHQNHNTATGILQQFSIFYTLGICMVFQGVFSSIFHICPSNVSLQFDTTMMYMMMVLVLIKVHQFRHPDTSAHVFKAMYIFFFVLLAESVSLYITNFIIKAIFNTICAILYLLLIVNGCIENYYYGVIKVSYRVTIPVLIDYLGQPPRHPFRLMLMMVFFLINFALVIVLYTKVLLSEKDISSLSTPILVLCSVNVFTYLSKYLFRKIMEINQEFKTGKCIRLIVLLFNLISFLLFGIFAGYYYSQRHQSRNLSPAESRNLNALCTFGNFFDNHDMWHFLSSTALFLAFLFLLTIDDDLFNKRKDEIKVY